MLKRIPLSFGSAFGFDDFFNQAAANATPCPNRASTLLYAQHRGQMVTEKAAWPVIEEYAATTRIMKLSPCWDTFPIEYRYALAANWGLVIDQYSYPPLQRLVNSLSSLVSA